MIGGLPESIVHALSPRDRRRILVWAVAELHGVEFDRVMAPDGAPGARDKVVVQARWHAMAAIRQTFGDSYSRIGRLFGRDHSSVLHGLKRQLKRQGGGNLQRLGHAETMALAQQLRILADDVSRAGDSMRRRPEEQP